MGVAAGTDGNFKELQIQQTTGHRAALHHDSARCPVAHTAPKGA
jgi:hypothetical protein